MRHICRIESCAGAPSMLSCRSLYRCRIFVSSIMLLFQWNSSLGLTKGEEGRRISDVGWFDPRLARSTGSCGDLGSPDTRRRQFHCLSLLPPPPPLCQTSPVSGNKLIPRVPHLCYTSPPPSPCTHPPLHIITLEYSPLVCRDNYWSASKTTKCATCANAN